MYDEHRPLLSAEELTVIFKSRRNKTVAVDNVSFSVQKGESYGIVGESGSGKTTVARTIMRICEPTSGKVMFDGKTISGSIPRELDRELTSRIQMIFQDPTESLNERAKVGYIVAEGLINKGVPKNERDKAVAKALSDVGLLPEFAGRFPHEFSGGQRQRIGIARALIMNPSLIIADEPISALDVSVRAQVLNLLAKLRRERGLTYVFIAHDLTAIRWVTDRIAVMREGKIVETATTAELFSRPLHPYTKALLSAVPSPDPVFERTRRMEIYDPAAHGYSAHTVPRLCEVAKGHFVLASDEELQKYKMEIRK